MNEIYTESALSDLVKEDLLRNFYFCQYIDRCVLKNNIIEIPITKLTERTREAFGTSNKKEIQGVFYRVVKEILQQSFSGCVVDLEKEKRIRVRLI